MAADARTVWNALAPDWIAHIRALPGDEGDIPRRHMLNALLLDLAGPCGGRTMLDVGAGEGYLCRMFARLGASVTGLDVSDRMIAAARAATTPGDGSVRYILGSIYQWPAEAEQRYDLLVANMVLNILPDHVAALRALADRLAPSGRLIVSIVHPAFDDVGPGWLRDAQGRTMWSQNRYFERVEGVAASGSPSFHRSLGDYVAGGVAAGLVVTALKEPVMTGPILDGLPADRLGYARIPYFCALRFELRG
jgi:SAM-dependent methyltransferase